MSHSNVFASSRAQKILLEAFETSPPRLDLAALSLSLIEKPDLSVPSALSRFDAWALRVRALPCHGVYGLDSLRHVLTVEEGLQGVPSKAFLPEHSFVNVAMMKKVGLPITLSVIYMEVARRAGVALYGVSVPNHFLLATDDGHQKWVIDPSNGDLLNEAQCAERLKKLSPSVKFRSSLLTPTSYKKITWRMLGQLKRLYLKQKDSEKALRVVDLMLSLSPNHPGELRARAALLSNLGGYRAALHDIEKCLKLSPSAPDRATLNLTAHALRVRSLELN